MLPSFINRSSVLCLSAAWSCPALRPPSPKSSKKTTTMSAPAASPLLLKSSCSSPTCPPTRPPISNNTNNYYYYHQKSRYGLTAAPCVAFHNSLSSHTCSSSSSSPAYSSLNFLRRFCPTKAFSHFKDFITNKGKPCIKDKNETVSQGSTQSAVEASQEEKEGNQANKGTLAERWRELQGLNHWEGLLDPLDLELRKSILFYGDLNQAVYDSFETDEHSKYTGACRFTKEEFFERTGLVKGRKVQYDMARYLYASSSVDMPGLVMMKSYSREAWSKESNWIGYVAVSNDEATKVLGRRDIVIVWRGTMRPFEWLDDFDFRTTDITSLLPPSSSQEKEAGDDKPKIEQGWLIIYTSKDSKSAFTSNSARDQVLNEVRCLMKKYKDEDVSITVTGHSLGAALAVVNAFDIALNGINLREGKEATLVTAIVCGCPGIGDTAFVKKCEDLEGLRVLRVKNKIDLITKYPGWLMGYKDVGDELLFDSADSPYFKKSKSPGDWHNLEAHLHMVAGTQGVGKPFKLAVNRDVALINKSSEFLRDEYLIPGSWWQMQYKGLVQQDDGIWYMPDREEGKRPKPEPLNDL